MGEEKSASEMSLVTNNQDNGQRMIDIKLNSDPQLS